MAGICFICKLTEQDEVTYGEFLTKNRLSVHYFCLLLSTNLPQDGRNDQSGFLRFLIKDIKKLVESISNTICSFCGKENASVHCSKCSMVFHQICGAKQGCLYEFSDEFKAYCPKHIDIQEQSYTLGERCIICEEILPEYGITNVVPTCCFKGWSHTQCIRQYALNAGYYFKCFLCRNTEYGTIVRSRGVYVPDRDANWERDPNAYKELEKRHHHCDASKCFCELGREHVTNGGFWRMLFCASCGFFGLHAYCARSANIVRIEGTFNCGECKNVLDSKMNIAQFDMNDTLVEGPEMHTLSQRSSGVSDDSVIVIESEICSMKAKKADNNGLGHNYTSSRIGNPNIKRRRIYGAYKLANDTENNSREVEAARPTGIPALFVESVHKTNPADDNKSGHNERDFELTFWSYDVANRRTVTLLSTSTELYLEHSASDTSSSLDNEVNAVTKADEVLTIRAEKLSCVVTGSSSTQGLTEADSNIPTCVFDRNTRAIMDTSAIAMEDEEVIIISDDSASDISELSPPKKIVDVRMELGGTDEELCARRMDIFWSKFEFERKKN